MTAASETTTAPHSGRRDSAPKTIAYLDLGLNPQTNASLIPQFRAAFPEFRVEVVTIPELVFPWHPANLREVYRRYRHEILARHKPFADCVLRTEWVFERVRRNVRRRFSEENVRFTFQTGSRLDGSVPGVPHFIYTDHTHLTNRQYPDQAPHWLFPPEWIALERQVYANARHLFTFSAHVRRSLIEDYSVPPAKITCAFAGSNLPPGGPPPSRDPAGKTILFVGLEWERKGGPLLVSAFRRVREEHPDARLVIIGCRPRLSEPGCEVLGRLEREEVAHWFERADIFCMPTRREPFGIVYIEAMLAGLPIVATEIGALPDMVESGCNGYLIPPGDEAALSSALSRLLTRPDEREKFGRIGRQLALTRYTWENTVKTIREQVDAAQALDRKNP